MIKYFLVSIFLLLFIVFPVVAATYEFSIATSTDDYHKIGGVGSEYNGTVVQVDYTTGSLGNTFKVGYFEVDTTSLANLQLLSAYLSFDIFRYLGTPSISKTFNIQIQGCSGYLYQNYIYSGNGRINLDIPESKLSCISTTGPTIFIFTNKTVYPNFLHMEIKAYEFSESLDDDFYLHVDTLDNLDGQIISSQQGYNKITDVSNLFWFLGSSISLLIAKLFS